MEQLILSLITIVLAFFCGYLMAKKDIPLPEMKSVKEIFKSNKIKVLPFKEIKNPAQETLEKIEKQFNV